MKKIRMIIPGEPRGKQRPRHTRSGTVYTPSETVAYEKEVKAAYWRNDGAETFHGTVAVLITAYYGIPKSAPKSAKLAMLDGTRLPNKKPDIDNVAKIIMDGLKGAAYDDDKQVVSLTAEKRYGEEPHVFVTVVEI